MAVDFCKCGGPLGIDFHEEEHVGHRWSADSRAPAPSRIAGEALNSRHAVAPGDCGVRCIAFREIERQRSRASEAKGLDPARTLGEAPGDTDDADQEVLPAEK